MSEPKRRRIKTEASNGAQEKTKIRVKIPRQRDSNGKLLPHRHKHTHGAHPSLDERSGTTQNNPFTIVTAESIGTKDLTEMEVTSGNNEFCQIERKKHRRGKAKEQKNENFTGLSEDFKETDYLHSRFLKRDDPLSTCDSEHETTFETAPFVEREIGTKTLIENMKTGEVTFDSEDDPFFIEVNRILKRNSMIRRHQAGEFTAASDDEMVIYEADENLDDNFDTIEMWKLYPRGRVPPELMPQATTKSTQDSMFGQISEPSEREFTDVSMLITASEGSGEYIEVSVDNEDAKPYMVISTSAINTKTTTTVTDSDSFSYYSGESTPPTPHKKPGYSSSYSSQKREKKSESVQSIKSLGRTGDFEDDDEDEGISSSSFGNVDEPSNTQNQGGTESYEYEEEEYSEV